MSKTYNEIYLEETEDSIQDFIAKVAVLDLALAARMKFAFEQELSKKVAEAYDDGFRDGNMGPAMVPECDEEVPF